MAINTNIPLQNRIPEVIHQGYVQKENPNGDHVVHTPYVQTGYQNYNQVVTTGINFDNPAAKIAQATLELKFKEFILEGRTLYPMYTFNPIAEASQVIVEAASDAALETLEALKESLEAEREKENCIKNNVDGIEQKVQKAFQGFLNDLIDIGIDFALEQINKLLPNGFKMNVGVSTDAEGNVTIDGVSVGPVGFDPQTNTLSLDGSIFDALAQEGIDAVNDVLPDFLQLSINSIGLSFGDIVVDFDDLENGSSFQVLPELSVRNEGGDIIVKVGDKEHSVVNVGKDILRRAVLPEIRGGVDSINRQMPFGFKIAVSLDKNTLLPSVKLGPLSFDFSTGDVNFDANALLGMGIGILDGYVNQAIGKLPGPLGSLARSLYKSLNIGGLLGQAIKKPSPDKSLNINESCKNGPIPGTPPINSSKPGAPPLWGDPEPSEYTGDVNPNPDVA